MNLRNPRHAIAFAALITCSTGCHSAIDRGPVHAFIAIDVSCQAEGRLVRYASWAYQAQYRLPAGSWLSIYEFGHDAVPIFEGPPIKSREEFNRKIGLLLTKPPAFVAQPVTRPKQLIDRLAIDLRSEPLPKQVLILTDGGVEDRSRHAVASLNGAMRGLASDRLASISALGVEPEYRSLWQEWLAGVSPKVAVRGEQDFEELLDRFSAGGVK